MTAPHIVDPAGLLGEALAEASPDLMRSLLQTMINALLSADADAVVGAEYGRPSPSRQSSAGWHTMPPWEAGSSGRRRSPASLSASWVRSLPGATETVVGA